MREEVVHVQSGYNTPMVLHLRTIDLVAMGCNLWYKGPNIAGYRG